MKNKIKTWMQRYFSNNKSSDNILEVFDPSKPPPCTPNREYWWWPIIGWVETKESKLLTKNYKASLDIWGSRNEKAF